MRNKLLLIIVGFLFGSTAIYAYAQGFPVAPQWIVNSSNQITQAITNTPIKFTGLTPSGCLTLTSGNVATTTGSPCATSSSFSTTSISAVFPITWNTSNAKIGFSGLGTTTNLTISDIPYVTGVNTFGDIATSTPSIGSVLTYTGTLGNLVGGTNGTFGIATGAVTNSMLANSTISGVSLGSNLASLTATDGTLTFSGSYNGSTARTVGINLANANIWTGLQQLNGNASTTQLTVTGATYLATTGGKVGIGTTSPATTLEVAGTLQVSGNPAHINFLDTGVLGDNINEQFSFFDYGNVKHGLFGYQGTDDLKFQNNYSTGGIAFNVNAGIEAMYINSAGDIGISSTTPTYPLSVGTTGSDFYVKSTGEVVSHDTPNNWDGQATPTRYISFKISTTTVWTGTSTIDSPYSDTAPVYAPFTGTFKNIICGTDAGNLTIEATDTTSGIGTYLVASTTAGLNNFTLAFTLGDKIDFIAGNPSSSPTSTPCTIGAIQNP